VTKSTHSQEKEKKWFLKIIQKSYFRNFLFPFYFVILILALRWEKQKSDS
jgi:hypothetical protein